MHSDDDSRGTRGERRASSRPASRRWIGRELELTSTSNSQPQPVEIRRLKEEEIVVQAKGQPPRFGDRVELSLPGTGGESALIGEVVALERARGGTAGVQVSIYVEEPLVRALVRLEAASSGGGFRAESDDGPEGSRSPGSTDVPAGSDEGTEQRGHRPNSELHWGWVAGDYDSLQAGKARATSAIEDINIDNLVDDTAPAKAGQSGKRKTDVYSKLSWSQPHTESPQAGFSPAPDTVEYARWKQRDQEEQEKTPERGARKEGRYRKGRAGPDDDAGPPTAGGARRLIPGGTRPVSPHGRYSSPGTYGLTPAPRRKGRSRAAGDAQERPARDPRAEPEVQKETRKETATGQRSSKLALERRERLAAARRRRVDSQSSGQRRSSKRRRAPEEAPKRPGREADRPPRPEPESPDWRGAQRDSAEWQAWGETSSFEQEASGRVRAQRDPGDSWDAGSPPVEREPAPDRQPRGAPAARSSREASRSSDRGSAAAVEPRAEPARDSVRESEAPGNVQEALRQSARDRRSFESVEGVRQIETRASGARRGIPAVIRGDAAPVVGIDFGTTFSKVAVFDGEEVVLIEDTSSKAATRAAVPSSVACVSDGTILIGEPAREFLATDPSQVVSSVKRVLGLKYSDPLSNGLLGSLACRSISGPNDAIIFEIQGRQFTVVEIASIILKHLVKMASNYVGAKVKKAVLTYPVDFDRMARRELELAAKMAGIEALAFVPEPVAAVMGCGFDPHKDSLVAVYDFGGGTFDASFVEVSNETFNVLGAAGDRWLGGDDLDELLARFVADEYSRTSGIRLHHRRVEYQRLLFACEEAKRWLSTLDSVDVILPRAAITADGPKTLLVPVERAHFEDLSEDVITSSLEVCRQAAEEAGISPEDADQLLLTGGTTRIPAVRKGAQRYFDRRGVAGIHPEHAVVIGAAVRAAVLGGLSVPEDFGERLRSHGASGHTVGLALADSTTEPIIDAAQRPPVAAHRLFSTSIDGQTACRIELVQGDSPRTDQNRALGGFVIDGLPPRPAGATNLDIYFELSSTGTLYVTAQDRTSGQRAQGTFDLNED